MFFHRKISTESSGPSRYNSGMETQTLPEVSVRPAFGVPGVVGMALALFVPAALAVLSTGVPGELAADGMVSRWPGLETTSPGPSPAWALPANEGLLGRIPAIFTLSETASEDRLLVLPPAGVEFSQIEEDQAAATAPIDAGRGLAPVGRVEAGDRLIMRKDLLALAEQRNASMTTGNGRATVLAR